MLPFHPRPCLIVGSVLERFINWGARSEEGSTWHHSSRRGRHAELEFRSQVSLKGSKRKGFDGDLKGCELLEMLQYNCEVEKPITKESVTRCWPIERMFRR